MRLRNVLMIAFHFPPQSGSSGLLRSLKFASYLPQSGWRPTVLTCHRRAYERLEEDRLRDIPPQVKIVRAPALDAKRHLSIGSRYPGWLAVPDRWSSWCLGGIPSGLRAIRDSETDVIFTTYPIASAVLLGLLLHRLSGKPWVVDFRDPMTEENYPPNPLTYRVHRWLERRVVRFASQIIFTTESTCRMYQKLYPGLLEDKCSVISNGYDEADFADLPPYHADGDDGPLRLVHGGVIYPEERDPRPLFRALRRLRQDGSLEAGKLRIELRASGFDDRYRSLIEKYGIDEIVQLLPPLPYRESLLDAADADALLVFQGKSCDRQIPAKVYEYLRLGRPILALTSHDGDTAALLRTTGGATIADLHDEREIIDALPRFLDRVAAADHPVAPRAVAEKYSRRVQARQLADCFAGISPPPGEMLPRSLPVEH